MKFHFEPDLDYQHAAIEAVCALFQGQETCQTEFTVTLGKGHLPLAQSAVGVGNRLTLLDDEILGNLHQVQIQNGLRPSASLDSGDFTVEMETGTGKTYVYLRTVFELNKRFGFSKFVIVVPSVAIKEGVYKTLQMTEEHFRGLYAGVPMEYFVYDSAKLGQVRNFATSAHIQIMVVTVGAINKFGDETEALEEETDDTRRREKSKNVMYRASEKTGGERPIDLIRNMRPIVIVDEPQSVDGGLDGKGRAALSKMHPLCTLRYSATHVDKHHMVYRLNAVDAYEKRLVKQIEVASASVLDAHNKPYVRLLAVSNKKGTISAKVELDVAAGTGVRRREVVVQDGDDLEQVTGRPVYHDCRVGEIRVARGNEYVELRVPGEDLYLRLDQTYGDVEPMAVQREMIRRTIREHLDKEKRLRPLGIKVLSLFFIDSVSKYRQYDADGNPLPGEYARIFEEEYTRLAKHPDYLTLFKEVDLSRAAHEVHGGYFSIDKKKVGSKSVEVFKDTSGNTKADDSTYSLIMREKEKLLGFDTPLKFIFSHSALREGWDNPNVFQICSLRDIQTERERRQSIGRGLRLCVNQNGERVRGFDVNTLTVVALERFEQFAENLQKEIEVDTGIRFGFLEEHAFASVGVQGEDGVVSVLGLDASKVLRDHFRAVGYVDAKGKIQDTLRRVLKDGTLSIPEHFEGQRTQIEEVLRKVSGRLEIKDADDRRTVSTRQAVLQSPEFKELWDRIKHKTTYRLHFDNEELITACSRALLNAPMITKPRLEWRKADIAIGKAGVEATEKEGGASVALYERDIELPDLLTELQDRTSLTRRSLCRILQESTRLDEFKRNPQAFIALAADTINRCKRLAVVDGIKYQRIGDGHYYAQELFEQEELTGYLKNMLLDTRKSVFEHVVYDSDVERKFASQLEMNSAVRVYAKLPGWFVVPTPLGTYNPDWAVLVEQDGEERLYFVVETKAELFTGDLRGQEGAKIECGKAHFGALRTDTGAVRYVIARNFGDLVSGIL